MYSRCCAKMLQMKYYRDRFYGHLVMLIDVMPGHGKMKQPLWHMLWSLVLMTEIMPSVADGMTTCIRVVYFNLSSRVCSTMIEHKHTHLPNTVLAHIFIPSSDPCITCIWANQSEC